MIQELKYRIKIDNDYLDLPSCTPSSALRYMIDMIDRIMDGSDTMHGRRSSGAIDLGTLRAVITHTPSINCITNAFYNRKIGKLIIKYAPEKCITLDARFIALESNTNNKNELYLIITFQLSGDPWSVGMKNFA